MSDSDSDDRVLRADPIFLAASVDAVFGLGTASVSVIAGIESVVASSALLFGLRAVSNLIAAGQGGGAASVGLNSPEIRFSTRQPTPPKRVILGTALVGGALFLEKVTPPWLYHGYAVSVGEISGFRGLKIGTNDIAIHTTTGYLPTDQIVFPLGHLDDGEITSTPDYANFLKCSFRTGTSDQLVDVLALDAYPSLGDHFRQRGVATVVLGYKHGGSYDNHQALWGNGGQPSAFFLVDGLPIPDPRDPTQVIEYDPTDDDAVAAAKATWKFSNNASLVQAFYLTQPWGGRISPSRIDWDKVAVAANYDDEPVGIKDGGYIKRHTIDGVLSLDQSPSDVMTGLLSANRGFVIDSGSKIWVTSSRPRSSVGTIHDAILSGGIEYRAAKPKNEVFNRVKCRFIADDREYNLADGPILDREDLQSDDGQLLETTLDLPFTLKYQRAERLQKAALETSRLGKTLTCRVDLAVLDQIADDLIGAACTVDSVLFPQASGSYLTSSVAFADGFSSLELSLMEYSAAIETDWDFTTDEVPFSLDDFTIEYRFDFSERYDSGYLALL